MDKQPSDRPRRTAAPLYEARYEHDACGVGFVADAGGRSRDRVLPLALAGLSALGHRGAFGADGESSDGAGVALPLDRSLLELIAGEAAAGSARDRLAVPATLPDRRSGRPGSWSRRPSPRPACRSSRWRAVPVDVSALGASAAASRPAFAHAIVARPTRAARTTRDRSPTRPSSAGSSSPGAASRPPPAPPAVRWPSWPCHPRRPARSCTRAWSSADGWPTSIPTFAHRSSSATRSSTSATPPTPIRSGASPSRSARSPTTARSTRSAAIARRSAGGRPTRPGRPSRRTCWPPARSCPRTARTRSRSTRRSSC